MNKAITAIRIGTIAAVVLMIVFIVLKIAIVAIPLACLAVIGSFINGLHSVTGDSDDGGT